MAQAERVVAGLRGLPWVLAALASAVVPHLPHLPAWVSLLLLAVATWRWLGDTRGWPLPPVWLRVLLVLLSAAATLTRKSASTSCVGWTKPSGAGSASTA